MEISAEERQELKVRKAKKMLLVVGIISIIMMFSGLTSGYIVSRGGAAFWVNINMPNSFWLSTVFMILSSVSMIIATIAAKKGNQGMLKAALLGGLVLGSLFVYSQYQGWMELADKGLNFAGDNFLEHLKGEYGKDYYITNSQDQLINLTDDGHYIDPATPETNVDEEIKSSKNHAASYFNMFVLLHALHVGGGLLYLLYLNIMGIIGRLGKHNSLKVSQGATYWHFVDLLWIYLLLFLHFIH